jgi:hypothetical protein
MTAAGAKTDWRGSSRPPTAKLAKLTIGRLVKPCDARLWVARLESDSRRRAELIVTKMSRVRGAMIVAVLLTALMVQAAWSGPGFQPPGIASAGNIAYPTHVMTPGIVTLMVNLDNSGNVQNLDVMR